jgi:hypothetical protein
MECIMEILIYGLKQGETREYMEDLLACFQVTDKAQDNIERVKQAASAQGFHSFRIAGFVPGTKPNFAKAVNV